MAGRFCSRLTLTGVGPDDLPPFLSPARSPRTGVDEVSGQADDGCVATGRAVDRSGSTVVLRGLDFPTDSAVARWGVRRHA